MVYPKPDPHFNQLGERGVLPQEQEQQQSRGLPPDVPAHGAGRDFSINQHSPVPSRFLSAEVSLLPANLPSSNDAVGSAINCDATLAILVENRQALSAAAALREVVEIDYPENWLLRLCLRSCQDVDDEGNLTVHPRFVRVKYGAGLSTLVECIFHDRQADNVMQEVSLCFCIPTSSTGQLIPISARDPLFQHLALIATNAQSQVPLVISHSAMDYSANAGQNAMIRHLRVHESSTKRGYAQRTELLQDMDAASLSNLVATSTTSVPASPPEISTKEGAASTKKKRRKKQGKEKGETDNDESTKEARVARVKKGASTGKGGKTPTKSNTPSGKKAMNKKRGAAEASSSAQTGSAGKTGEGPSMASPPETSTKEGAAFTKKKGGKKQGKEKDEIDEDDKEDKDASSIAEKGAAAGKEDDCSSDSDSEAEAADKDEGKSTTEKSGKKAKKKRSVTTGKGNEAEASQEDAPGADESKGAETPPKKKHKVTPAAYQKRAKLHHDITVMKQGHGEDWCKLEKRDFKVDEMRSLINLIDVPLAKRDQKLSKASKDVCEDSIEISRLDSKDFEKSFLELESWLAEHKEVSKTGNGKDIDHDES